MELKNRTAKPIPKLNLPANVTTFELYNLQSVLCIFL